MKKKTFIILIAFFTFNISVKAGSSLSTSTSNVYNENSFNVTASIDGAATWDVHVTASGPVSGCTISNAGYTSDLSETSKSFTASCQATGTGNININLSGTITNGNGVTSKISGSKTVTVTNVPVVQPKPSNNSNKGTSQKSNSNKPSKSNNNYLKSFGVEGYNLSSEFNKDNGDYSVTVPYDTKEVKVIYEKEDDKASISGDEGVKSVSVGENKFTITVTAENGEQRNYTVNVIVEEKPIIIKKNNDEYSVVTKEEDLPKLDIEHDVITLNIQDTEVKAYRIDSIDYVLIALRDKNNDVKLYKFDSFKDDEKEPIYTLYQDINLSGIYLVLTEPKSIPNGYKKVSIKINGNSVTAYKKNKGFYLVYGLNTSNNKKSFYSYDEGENTLQRYNIEELNDTLKENDNLKKFAFLLCIGLIAAFIIIIIICVKKCENKEAKELRKEEKKNKKLEIQNQKKETKKQRKEEKRLKKEAKKVEDKVEDDE